jgi:hypothetical protein
MSAPSARRSALTCFAALVVALGLFRYLHALAVLLWEAPFIDFAHYYTYATVVRLGQNPFDPQAVAGVDALLAIRRAGSAANYPPLFYLLMQPWTLLDFRTAALMWFALGQTCVASAVVLCLRRVEPLSSVGVAATLFVVCNYQPLIESAALGQTNALLLLLVTMTWWGARTDRPSLAAACVALCPAVKVQYALLLPALWWMGQRRIAGRALAMIAAGAVLGVALLGPAHHLEYLRYLAAPPDYLRTWTANVSLAATLHRLVGSHGGARVLATALTLVAAAALLVVIARTIPRRVAATTARFDCAWGLVVAAVPLLSPLTEEHHLVVLLFPLALLLTARGETDLWSVESALLVGSVLLLGSRYSLERFPAFHEGALSLLATGKLVGTLSLAWLLARLLRAESRG